ncbi:MAG: hypothetical protein ABDH37_07590 [Candidatus Hydrothermales bacterium]
MKKLVLALIKVAWLYGGGLSFWGLDRIVTFDYIGNDSIRTPYFQGRCVSNSTIKIINVLSNVSFALYQRTSLLFSIPLISIKFTENTSSTSVSGFALPVYGNNNNSLPEGVILPDTFYIFHDTTYTWTPPGVPQIFITDLDRDQTNDTVLITYGLGRIMGIDTVQLPIGEAVSVHIRIEYKGKGRFGNGDSLYHSLILDRWWAPVFWNGQIQVGFGLVKEIFFQVDSSPGLLFKANRSTGHGSSLLASVGIEESKQSNFYNNKIKNKSFYIVTKNEVSFNDNNFLLNLNGRRGNRLKGGIYFIKNDNGKALKIIFIR